MTRLNPPFVLKEIHTVIYRHIHAYVGGFKCTPWNACCSAECPQLSGHLSA